MYIFVSACLLGTRCRYDGKSVPCKAVIDLKDKYSLVPLCPEITGGLETPREPAELKNGNAFTEKGADVTGKYVKGAVESLRLAKLLNCKYAILKKKSPSCGSGKIYDGSFSGILIDGFGITAKLFKENDIKVFDETQVEQMIKEIENL